MGQDRAGIGAAGMVRLVEVLPDETRHGRHGLKRLARYDSACPELERQGRRDGASFGDTRRVKVWYVAT